jgi:aldose 1-epimerase
LSDRKIDVAVLQEGDVRVSLLSYGARLQDWRVAHRGKEVPVVLGHANPDAYRRDPFWLGALVGRVANRISGAQYSLNGETFSLSANEGANTLHGGVGGFSHQHWNIERDGDRRVELTLTSPDGDQGFGGRLDLRVVISLKNGWLSYDIMAASDRPTPVNIAHHAYYNLMGGGDVRKHLVDVAASRWTPVDSASVPTGQIANLNDAHIALRDGACIEDALRALKGTTGFDMNYVLDQDASMDQVPTYAARVRAENGLSLTVKTDQPCMQFYSGHKLAAPFAAYGGLCLEPQGYVDGLNQSGFPISLATPELPYRQQLSLKVSAT